MCYTVEVYKKDGRVKSGERLQCKVDHENLTHEELIAYYTRTLSDKCRFEVHKTWVTRKNLMSGLEYKERYDTPLYCSPSSEGYWSM